MFLSPVVSRKRSNSPLDGPILQDPRPSHRQGDVSSYALAGRTSKGGEDWHWHIAPVQLFENAIASERKRMIIFYYLGQPSVPHESLRDTPYLLKEDDCHLQRFRWTDQDQLEAGTIL